MTATVGRDTSVPTRRVRASVSTEALTIKRNKLFTTSIYCAAAFHQKPSRLQNIFQSITVKETKDGIRTFTLEKS